MISISIDEFTTFLWISGKTWCSNELALDLHSIIPIIECMTLITFMCFPTFSRNSLKSHTFQLCVIDKVQKCWSNRNRDHQSLSSDELDAIFVAMSNCLFFFSFRRQWISFINLIFHFLLFRFYWFALLCFLSYLVVAEAFVAFELLF